MKDILYSNDPVVNAAVNDYEHTTEEARAVRDKLIKIAQDQFAKVVNRASARRTKLCMGRPLFPIPTTDDKKRFDKNPSKYFKTSPPALE